MSEAHLTCLSPAAAAAVVAEVTRPDDPIHTVRQDGKVVIIGYYDARWPMDIADWAFENGYANDDNPAALIGGL